jgi:hypothetical protein
MKVRTWRDLAQSSFPDKELAMFTSEDDCKQFVFDNVNSVVDLERLFKKKPVKKQSESKYNQTKMIEAYNEAYEYCCGRNKIQHTEFIWSPFPRWGKVLKETANLILQKGVKEEFLYEVYKEFIIWGFDYFLGLSKQKGSTLVFTPQIVLNNINLIIQHRNTRQSKQSSKGIDINNVEDL